MCTAGFASLDVRVSREFKHGKADGPALTVGLDAFNLTSRVNYASYIATIGSPLFLQPVSARAPRQLQLSSRVKF